MIQHSVGSELTGKGLCGSDQINVCTVGTSLFFLFTFLFILNRLKSSNKKHGQPN